MCMCLSSEMQRLLTELIIYKPVEPLDFMIDFLKRDSDGELQTCSQCCESSVLMFCKLHMLSMFKTTGSDGQ